MRRKTEGKRYKGRKREGGGRHDNGDSGSTKVRESGEVI